MILKRMLLPVILTVILLLPTACLRTPGRIRYTADGFRREVRHRLGHQLKKIGTISVPGGNGVRQIITAESLLVPPYALSPEAKAGLGKCLKPATSERDRFKNLYNCMLGASGGFSYIADSTLSADTCYQSRQGNCFSMTNLLVGAARFGGLEACYMLVEDIIGNQAEGNTVIHSNHIITAVRIGPKWRLVDFIPNSKRYHYLTLLSDIEAAGLYYNNLGARLLLDGHNNEAETLLRVAAALYPDSYQVQNNLGVLILREGNVLKARAHFLRALGAARFPDLVLGNVMNTFQKTGNMKSFELLRKDLEKAKRRNPYFYIELARRYYRKKEYRAVLRECKIARRINRTIPEIYLLQFRSYGALGMTTKKLKAYKKLLKYSHSEESSIPVITDTPDFQDGKPGRKP
ncbi:MAG: tetratricopeptide repeat protein [Acidobacteria bacterium]|nr:tetratricopeptide repeat protein [Acidobacteriota bacterium]